MYRTFINYLKKRARVLYSYMNSFHPFKARTTLTFVRLARFFHSIILAWFMIQLKLFKSESTDIFFLYHSVKYIQLDGYSEFFASTARF